MTNEHIHPEDFADYFEGVLPEEAEWLIEDHLSTCGECARLAQITLELFDGVEHLPELVQRLAIAEQPLQVSTLEQRLSEAIQIVRDLELEPERKKYFDNWITKWKSKAEGAVEILIDSVNDTARILNDELSSLTGDNPAWQFEYAQYTQSRMRSDNELGDGEIEISVEMTGGSMIIHVHGTNLENSPRELLLLLPEADTQPRIAQIDLNKKKNRGEAIIIDVPSGRVIIAFGPLRNEAQ